MRKVADWYQSWRIFWAKTTNKILIVISAALIIFTTWFYYRMVIGSQTILVDQTYDHNLILARTGALSLENYFKYLSKTIKLFTSNEQLSGFIPSTQKLLDDYVDEFRNTPYIGALIADKEGQVIFNSNWIKKVIITQNVADREYFQWATTAKAEDVHISKPVISKLGAYQGKPVINITMPLIKDGQFNGVVTSAVAVDKLAQDYLEALKICPATKIYLINQEGGYIWYASEANLFGQDIYSLVKQSDLPDKNKLIDSISQKLSSFEEGKTEQTWLVNNLPTRHVIVYMPVKVGDSKWMLIVATPFNVIEEWMAFFNSHYLAAFGFIIGLVLFFSLLVILGVRLARQEGFKLGFENGIKHKSSQTKSN